MLSLHTGGCVSEGEPPHRWLCEWRWASTQVAVWVMVSLHTGGCVSDGEPPHRWLCSAQLLWVRYIRTLCILSTSRDIPLAGHLECRQENIMYEVMQGLKYRADQKQALERAGGGGRQSKYNSSTCFSCVADVTSSCHYWGKSGLCPLLKKCGGAPTPLSPCPPFPTPLIYIYIYNYIYILIILYYIIYNYNIYIIIIIYYIYTYIYIIHRAGLRAIEQKRCLLCLQ